MTMTTSPNLLRRLAPIAAIASLAGCALDATNPGPIQSEFLETRSALTAVVNGAGRDLAEALNWVAYTSAAIGREIHPAGSTGAFGITPQQQIGKSLADDGSDWWDQSQRARWTAEDAVTRVDRVLGTSASNSATLAQGLVWVGYANRLLGENFCDGVINGGPKQPASIYYERAEAAFTRAITVAQAASNTALVSAATAGRASVRLNRGNTAGAATDAAAVASTFAYRMPYYNLDAAQYNRIFWASANLPYRAHTAWNTYFENYRKTTRDPRTPFDSSLTVLVGDAAVGTLGRVRWYFQTKHNGQTSPINLATGWEMRLIEAEVKLINNAPNAVQEAVTLINERRRSTAINVPAVTATTVEEAWLALKRERFIELWLEGRRLGDLRRWAAANRPGTLGPLETMAGRDLCFVTPLSEFETNPNF
jgi:hypothetical protein